MTFKEGMNLCFAWNSQKQCCRCLKETDCNKGLGKTRSGLKCKFYKPRSDENNNQKMREFLKTSSKIYKSGKCGIDKFTDGVLKTLGVENE